MNYNPKLLSLYCETLNPSHASFLEVIRLEATQLWVVLNGFSGEIPTHPSGFMHRFGRVLRLGTHSPLDPCIVLEGC